MTYKLESRSRDELATCLRIFQDGTEQIEDILAMMLELDLQSTQLPWSNKQYDNLLNFKEMLDLSHAAMKKTVNAARLKHTNPISKQLQKSAKERETRLSKKHS